MNEGLGELRVSQTLFCFIGSECQKLHVRQEAYNAVMQIYEKDKAKKKGNDYEEVDCTDHEVWDRRRACDTDRLYCTLDTHRICRSVLSGIGGNIVQCVGDL